MSDNELEETMLLVLQSRKSYVAILNELEKEYKRRFGNLPSDVDDDVFISIFHYGQGECLNVKELTDNAKYRKKRIH